MLKPNFRHVFQTVHPVARQIPQPRFFAFAADAVVKQQRLANREPRRRGVCADLFKLANVVALFRLRRHQRPKLLDLVALHIKQARSFRRVEPLVQTRPKVVAAEIFLFEVKLRKRMRAVDDRFDSLSRAPSRRLLSPA